MSWSDRTTYQGHRVNVGTKAILDAANKMLSTPRFGGEREPMTMTQGSWSSGVSASSGTHSGAAAFDLTAFNADNRIRVLRMLGVAAWVREKYEGPWPRHIHGIVDGDGGASPGALRQVEAYHAGRNGLANGGMDRFWRPDRVPVLFRLTADLSSRVSTKARTLRDEPYAAGKAAGTLAAGERFCPVAGVRNAHGNVWLIDATGRCIPNDKVVVDPKARRTT